MVRIFISCDNIYVWVLVSSRNWLLSFWVLSVWPVAALFADGTTAAVAKEPLEGHCIYDGGYCKLHLTYSRHTDLNAKVSRWILNFFEKKIKMNCIKPFFLQKNLFTVEREKDLVLGCMLLQNFCGFNWCRYLFSSYWSHYLCKLFSLQWKESRLYNSRFRIACSAAS